MSYNIIYHLMFGRHIIGHEEDKDERNVVLALY